MTTKPANGKFSLSYLLFGGGIADWLRPLGDDWRRLIVYGLVGCFVYVVFTHFFPAKPQENISRPEANQSVNVMPFGKVQQPITQTSTSTTTQTVVNPKSKKIWWIPTPYVYAQYGATSPSGGVSNFSSYQAESQVGVGARIDFDFWNWDK